jgi:thiol-disulfide isomerase/thioredoxin
MAYPDPNFLPGRRYILSGAVSGAMAALALPARAAGGMSRFEKAKAPKPLPDLAFQDADDKPRRFADFHGRALLINFWATWCVPCVKEMPSLDRLQAMFPKDKFVILPLSIDGPTKPKVAPFYKDKKLANLGIYFDQGRKAMQGLGVTLLPTSILVDPQGRELGRLEGDADWDLPDGVALMKAAVASQS